MKGKAVFGSNEGLWITDGTSEGTKLLRDKTDFLNPTKLSNSQVLFTTLDSSNGDHKLWVTNGTTAGTKSLNLTVNPSDYGFLNPLGNGKVIFNRDDGIHGDELWITDGTVAGTRLVKDIYPGKTASNPFFFRSLGNGMAIFSASDPFSYQNYITDGTKAGTVPLKNYNPTLNKAVGASPEFWPISYIK